MILGKFNGWNVVTLPLTQIRSVDFTEHEIVAQSSSPWTGQTQTYDWGQSLLSAVVTLATLTRAQAAAWTGALRSCRGPLNVFALGDPSKLEPLGVAGTNLAPDPGFNLPLGLVWSQPDANWWIDCGTGYRGSNALRVASPESPSTVLSYSQPIAVTPGQSYRLSGYLDASAATVNGIILRAAAVGMTATYLDLFMAAGSQGMLSGSFMVPGGITQIELACITDATFPSGSVLSFSALSLSSGAPVVNGANQTGYSLITSGWPPSVKNLLLPGDDFTLMSAGINGGDISIPRLHGVVDPVNSDGSGNAILSIWPPLREMPPNGGSLILSEPQGLFRLAKTDRQWNVNYDHTASMSFNIVEAL